MPMAEEQPGAPCGVPRAAPVAAAVNSMHPAAGPPHVLMAVQVAPPLQDEGKAAANTAAANGVQLIKAGSSTGLATLVNPGQALAPLQQAGLMGFAGLQPMAALNLLGQLGPGSQLMQAGQAPSFVQGQGGPLGLLVASRGTHAQLVNAPHGLGATSQMNSASQPIFLTTAGQPQQQGTPILLNSATGAGSQMLGLPLAAGGANQVVQVVAANGAVLTTTIANLPALSQQLSLAAALGSSQPAPQQQQQQHQQQQQAAVALAAASMVPAGPLGGHPMSMAALMQGAAGHHVGLAPHPGMAHMGMPPFGHPMHPHHPMAHLGPHMGPLGMGPPFMGPGGMHPGAMQGMQMMGGLLPPQPQVAPAPAKPLFPVAQTRLPPQVVTTTAPPQVAPKPTFPAYSTSSPSSTPETTSGSSSKAVVSAPPDIKKPTLIASAGASSRIVHPEEDISLEERRFRLPQYQTSEDSSPKPTVNGVPPMRTPAPLPPAGLAPGAPPGVPIRHPGATVMAFSPMVAPPMMPPRPF